MHSIFGTLETEACIKLLKDNYIGRLAFNSGATPYITPITYYYDAKENCILSYSTEGHKIAAMRKLNLVALQVDQIDTIQNWRSVLIHGNFEELKGSTAKYYLHKFAEGVQETIAKTEGSGAKFISDFSSRLTQKGIPIVYRIIINDISGKFRDGK
ncbi:pyridoxamine 5'-phosphate oxidase family protein [Muriicola sp. Z0-33]|uniref:pyridoxamine 5'-phosphate oxidase family protein n=1 Tax=Muriicola sp. Z0-33 TaxID=2816957 RepID=UPI002237F80C|nr:pyridoxamine 5'-phosphate oxidase family protein [Muriicola sp. Z0-33]MCW5517177.1 pyridoxamine 5'-phosphate oxidase family protein [Muriicola sp. Z0-33]